MANPLYHPTANYSSPPGEPDEISVFLQQILLRSASSSASSSSSSFPSAFTRQQSFGEHLVGGIQVPGMVLGPGQISVPEPVSGLNTSPGVCLPEIGVANLSSSSVGTLDNDPNDYDCESEEGVEALMEGGRRPKPTPPRNSSKRSRAAEVHNLSEKRRRSRINEKMKALQKLIPNSNKTDKASMLDEAIEYLKQLQLQVQMLTMRNGLSLYPVCLPGMLQQQQQPNQISSLRMDITSEDESSKMKMTKEMSSIRSGFSEDDLLNLQSNCIKQAPVAAGTFEIEYPASQDNSRHFRPSASSSKGICRDEVLQQPHMDMEGGCSSFMVGKSYCIGTKATTTRPSNQKANTLEESILSTGGGGGDSSGGGGLYQLPNLIASNPNFSSQFNNLQVGRRSANDSVKKESTRI